jgi:hypothetical protein
MTTFDLFWQLTTRVCFFRSQRRNLNLVFSITPWLLFKYTTTVQKIQFAYLAHLEMPAAPGKAPKPEFIDCDETSIQCKWWITPEIIIDFKLICSSLGFLIRSVHTDWSTRNTQMCALNPCFISNYVWNHDPLFASQVCKSLNEFYWISRLVLAGLEGLLIDFCRKGHWDSGDSWFEVVFVLRSMSFEQKLKPKKCPVVYRSLIQLQLTHFVSSR